MSKLIFTIGHSNHAIDSFLSLLAGQGITAIADVRSQPYSRRFPDYSQRALRQHLAGAGVAYVFLGAGLGARPADRSCYERGVVDFGKLRATDAFRRDLARVIAGSDQHRICLLCAERDPAECHRTILVAQAVHDAGRAVSHILADGGLETHAALLARIAGADANSAGLFGNADLYAAALMRQERRIAYQDEEGEDAA